MYMITDWFRVVWQAYSNPSTRFKVQFKTSVKVYADEPVALFSIEYTDGLTNASIRGVEDNTLSSFPSFILEELGMKRASLTWARGSKCTNSTS